MFSVVRRLTPTAPARVHVDCGVVSFTFDDFPKSATVTGGRILENHGVRGTFYACLNLAGTDGALGSLFDKEDFHRAYAQGHELACHTYTHMDCSRSTVAEIIADVARNAAEFSTLIADFAATNFAYPFGRVSLAARRALARRFSSCRGIQSGLNRGVVDLAELRANRIYDGVFDREALCRLIDHNHSVGGWLIFYTHDVRSAPSPFGCKPEQLEAIVAYAAQRSPVLPMGKALTLLKTGSD